MVAYLALLVNQSDINTITITFEGRHLGFAKNNTNEKVENVIVIVRGFCSDSVAAEIESSYIFSVKSIFLDFEHFHRTQ